MHTGYGQVTELVLEDENHYLRVRCPSNLIPAPGQYLLASPGADPVLPVSLFHTDLTPEGFVAAAPAPVSWSPGTKLHLRGPLGRGFRLPVTARKVGLIALDRSPARLRGLIGPALKQKAAVVLLCDFTPEHLPDDVEVQPLTALPEILAWAEFLALDVGREDLDEARDLMKKASQLSVIRGAQVLVYTPQPCGGAADCGVCAVTTKSGWKLACKEGPVFEWNELL